MSFESTLDEFKRTFESLGEDHVRAALIAAERFACQCKIDIEIVLRTMIEAGLRRVLDHLRVNHALNEVCHVNQTRHRSDLGN